MIWQPLNGSSPLRVDVVRTDFQIKKMQLFKFLIRIHEYADRLNRIFVVSLIVQCLPSNMIPISLVYLKKKLGE